MRKRVLVIDDEMAIRAMLFYVLDVNGCDVHCVPDGASALVFLESMHFDVVICDFRLRGTNGSELARAARKYCPQSLIIGISGDNAGKDFFKAGANAFFQKPFRIEDIISLIQREPLTK